MPQPVNSNASPRATGPHDSGMVPPAVVPEQRAGSGDPAVFTVHPLGPSRTLASIDAQGWRPLHRHTLRFALAMRGGVSLAVWIGGAVAEIDVLRGIRLRTNDEGELAAFVLRADEEELSEGLTSRIAAYALMLHGEGIDRVDVDILAGASAGGLNSVMYAVAQRAGRHVDELKDTWRDVGGLADLMHPPGFGRVASLLRGDDYFWPHVREALVRFHTAETFHPDLIPGRITVDLSATLLDSEDAPDPDTREGRGDFHFTSHDNGVRIDDDDADEDDADVDRTDGDDAAVDVAEEEAYVALAASVTPIGIGNLIPTRHPALSSPHPETLDALDRLAYAARTTSSFPGAFEPSTIYSSTGDAALGPTPRPNMRFAFGAHRESDETPYRVIDGGVFDNIPITRALGAVKTRASLTPSRRTLLYLDPSPALDPTVGAMYEEGRAQFSSAVLGAVSRRFRHETEGGELEELDRFVDEVSLSAGRWESFATLSDVPWDADARAERVSAYVRYRHTSDVNLLIDVLSFPARAQLVWLSPRRSVWRGIDRDAAESIRADALFAYNERSWGVVGEGPASVIRGPQGLLDAAQCVLSAVQWIENAAIWAQDPVWSTDEIAAQTTARTLAYDVLEAATILRERAFVNVLDFVAKSNPPGTAPAPDFARRVIATWLAPTDEEGVVEEAWARLETAWDVLALPFGRLRGIADATESALVEAAKAKWSARVTLAERDPGLIAVLWHECPWRSVIEKGFTPPESIGAVDLPPLFAATGMPPIVSQATYWRIDGHSRPGDLPEEGDGDLAVVARALRSKDRARRAATALADRRLTLKRAREHMYGGADVLPASIKLAGTRIANFSGFLSAAWRENDWWWGRLDAAAGLARALRSDQAAVAQSGIVSDLLADRAEAVSASPVPIVPPSPGAGLDGGLDGIGALDPDYIAGLANRGTRVLSRALPTPGSLLGKSVVRIVSWMLRPVTSLLPAALDPPRIAFAALALVVLATALTWPAAPFPGSGSFTLPADAVTAVTAVIAIALAARGIVGAAARWKVLRSADPDASDIRRWRSAALARAGLVLLATAATLVPLAVAARMELWFVAGIWVVTALVCGLLTGRVARKVSAGGRPPGAARWVPALIAGGLVLAGVGFGIAGLVGAPVHTREVDPRVWAVSWVAGTGLAIGLSLLWGWQKPWFAVVTGFAAVALGFGASALAVWLGLPAFGPLAWIVAVVVWGNVVWLAPELGWGSRTLDDRPRTAA